MATPVNNTANAQAPAPKAPPKPERARFSILRPFRYAHAFTGGAIGGFFEGMASYGRKGFFAGAGLGILVGIATGGTFFTGTVLLWAVGGMAALGTIGAVAKMTGDAFGGVGRVRRREKYADELAERQEARERNPAQGQRPTRGYDYRDAYAVRRFAGDFNFERSLQQERENDRDYATYWQDKVSQQTPGNGRGY